MLLGKYYISDHARKQYSRRINFYGSVEQAIKKDLRTLNIKNIVYGDEAIHVFTKNYKEFIFIRKTDKLCLSTVIKRNFEDNQKTIDKRKNLVSN